MPFVTVVTLGAGASATSDYISSIVETSGSHGDSTLMKIRHLSENEVFDDINVGKSSGSMEESKNLKKSKKKSLSSLDLSGQKSSLMISPVSESGYSSPANSISSDSSSNGSGVSVLEVQCSELSETYEGSGAALTSSVGCPSSSVGSVTSGGSHMFLKHHNTPICHPGKSSIWKTWIRNKFTFLKNGKYSFERNSCLPIYSVSKTNKSLLIDCSYESEYPSLANFKLTTRINDNGLDNEYVQTCECNLFVRECLNTYTTSFLELHDDKEVEDCNGIREVVTPELKAVASNEAESKGTCQNGEGKDGENVLDGRKTPGGSAPSSTELSEVTTPKWFWENSTKSASIKLDDAGVVVEGKAVVNYNNENLGLKFSQVKWDFVDEKFFLIVWKEEAGEEFVCKVDLNSTKPIWHGDHKVSIMPNLVLSSEQRRGLFRELYTICAEVCPYNQIGDILFSNVARVPKLVQLFQKVAIDLTNDLIGNKIKPEPKLHRPPLESLYLNAELEKLDFRFKTEEGRPIEPYVVTMSLFDIKNSQKISEDFRTFVDVSGKPQLNSRASFQVSEPSDNVYLVLRIEKTLQAADHDAYVRSNTDGKMGTRISKSISSSPLYTKDHKYRMPLGWTSCCVFKKSYFALRSEDDSYEVNSDALFSPIYKYEKYSDEELIKILSDLRKPEKVTKLTQIPGEVQCKLSAMECKTLKRKNRLSANNNSEVETWVNEFPTNPLYCFTSFVHVLYVYPLSLSLNVNSITGKVRARNILCRVYLRSEDDIDANPLSDSPGVGNVGTYVLHHRTNPEWYTEIKMTLPLGLDPRLHLLFQFYHISCSFEKANKSKQLENVVGYAWLPLLNKFRFIGGEHCLPIASTLPSGYLQIQPLGLGKGTVADSMKNHNAHGSLYRPLNRKRISQQYSGPDIAWMDKCSLSVRLHLLSTVWTKSGCLGAFFAHAEKLKLTRGASKVICDEEVTLKMIRSLDGIDLCTLRDFFPTIMNQLLCIAAVSKGLASAVFKFCIECFHCLIKSKMEAIIEDYICLRYLSIENELETCKRNPQTYADILIESWIDLFETSDGVTIATSLDICKHVFSMIIKSVAAQGMSVTGMNLEDEKIVKLIQLFTSEINQRYQVDYNLSRSANENLAEFISQLLSVVQKPHIAFAILNAYLASFSPGDSYKLQDFKFSLLQKLCEHPLFIELNSALGDDEYTRLDHPTWCKRHFLVASVMKQCRSGLGEVVNVRSLALKPILCGLSLHESREASVRMWLPWLRVVCDNLNRIANTKATLSSRYSSVSTMSSVGSCTLVQTAVSKAFGAQSERENHLNLPDASLTLRNSSLSLNMSNLTTPALSINSSMVSINAIGHGSGNGSGSGSDKVSLDRFSIGSIPNGDYLEAISAIKTSNPIASNTQSVNSEISDSETIVNEEKGSIKGSGDVPSIRKSSIGDDVENGSLKPVPEHCSNVDKDNVVLRRYDKLDDVETSQLLISGLYLLKKQNKEELKLFWTRSTPQEKSSLLQMIHLACIHFVIARKNTTITRKKMVGIAVPPTMPPSPKSSLMMNKKWSSLPLKTEDLSPSEPTKDDKFDASTEVSDWKTLSHEATFICVDTLSNLSKICQSDQNEMRDVIRTSLDVAKASEDSRIVLGTLKNLSQIPDLASIVFAKGNEDLCYQLFCDLLNGFGVSYLMSICIQILSQLFKHDPERTTSQSLLAISSISLNTVFLHNFRKALAFMSSQMHERSSFVLSITEKLSFIDAEEFEKRGTQNNVGVTRSLGRSHVEVSSKNEKHTANGVMSMLELGERLGTIINSMWILKSCNNDYRIPELHLRLADSFSYFAKGKLRIDALDALKDEHLRNKRFSEALMCEMHVAARLSKWSASPGIKTIMLGASQNLSVEFSDADDHFEGEDTTEDLIQRLESCVHLCNKAERYELMLEVYRIIVAIQEHLSDYAALEHCYHQMSRACNLIQNKRERFLATYYKIVILGPKQNAGKRQTATYVYKEPNVTSLTEVCTKIESTENAIIYTGDVEKIPDDDKTYATITHVFAIAKENPDRKLWSEEFRKHQNVNKFYYDTPFVVKHSDRFSVDNKAAVHEQWKRRTTITTEYSFPAVVCRLKAINSSEQDLSPIIVAIDDMQRRVSELRAELHSHDIKRIQLRLQGSVSVQVNQGPLAYAKAFFEKEMEYSTQEMNKLKAIFRDFIECCGELLVRNGSMIPQEQMEYQSQLEADYLRLCQVLSPYLGIPELAYSRIGRGTNSSTYSC